MSRIGALGPRDDVDGFALAGVVVLVADDAGAVDAAWDALPDDVGVLLLAPRAADCLATRLSERPELLTLVMPR